MTDDGDDPEPNRDDMQSGSLCNESQEFFSTYTSSFALLSESLMILFSHQMINDLLNNLLRLRHHHTAVRGLLCEAAEWIYEISL